jgi:hypothetical protein
MGPMFSLRFALLVAFVAVTAHDATFLIGHGLEGYPAALGATGHDAHWLPVAIGVAGLLLGAATIAAARWWRLRRQLAAFAGGATHHRIGPILPGALRLAARLFVVALAVFVLQENLEAMAIGAPAPGAGIVVSSAYLAAIPAVATVALLFAAMSELIDARILGLERALVGARRALPRPLAAPVIRASVAAGASLRSRSSQPDLGRAPPASTHA